MKSQRHVVSFLLRLLNILDCPLVFKYLRERFGIDDVEYRESLTRSQPVHMDASGKSGAKFYRSYDKLFIIKSLTSEEVERMHSFLKHYHPYVVEKNGCTLLPQYLGMYRFVHNFTV